MSVKTMALAATVFTSISAGSAYAQTTFAGNTDIYIADGVRHAIAVRPALAGDKIQVRAAGGVIYLSGMVDTPTESALAESVAQTVEGVQKVVNSTGVNGGN